MRPARCDRHGLGWGMKLVRTYGMMMGCTRQGHCCCSQRSPAAHHPGSSPLLSSHPQRVLWAQVVARLGLHQAQPLAAGGVHQNGAARAAEQLLEHLGCRAGQGRAGQGRAGQGRAGQGRRGQAVAKGVSEIGRRILGRLAGYELVASCNQQRAGMHCLPSRQARHVVRWAGDSRGRPQLLSLTCKVHGAVLAPPGGHHLEPGVLILLLPVGARALRVGGGALALAAGAGAACRGGTGGLGRESRTPGGATAGGTWQVDDWCCPAATLHKLPAISSTLCLSQLTRLPAGAGRLLEVVVLVAVVGVGVVGAPQLECLALQRHVGGARGAGQVVGAAAPAGRKGGAVRRQVRSMEAVFGRCGCMQIMYNAAGCCQNAQPGTPAAWAPAPEQLTRGGRR
jgi:hypothetical protein